MCMLHITLTVYVYVTYNFDCVCVYVAYCAIHVQLSHCGYFFYVLDIA